MRRAILLAAVALLAAGPSQASSIDEVQRLNQQGVSFDLDAAPNGDLYMTCRTGSGSQTNFKTITYFKYTKATNSWSNGVEIFPGDAFTVSTDIDTNQPAIAHDPVNGGAWVAFSGNVRRDNSVPAYFVRDSDGAVSAPFNLLGNLGMIRELRAVDITVADDGHLWGCFNYTNVSGNADINGIYCNNDGAAVERATGKAAAGEGLSVSVGPGSQPHVLTTFGASGTNAAWSPRDSAPGGIWNPGGLLFGGIPNSAGKISCVDTTSNQFVDCAAVTAISTFARATFLFRLDRSSGTPQVTKASAGMVWGVDVDPGDFNSENLKYARSAQGKEAVAFAADAISTALQPFDVMIVLVKPAGVDWPTAALTDVNNDGIHDEIGGSGQGLREVFLTNPSPPLMHVFEGTQGRAAIAFVDAETPGVGFSGEDLWVAYYVDDQLLGQARGTRAARITVGLPPVPDVSTVGALLALLGFSLVLVRFGAGRRSAEAA